MVKSSGQTLGEREAQRASLLPSEVKGENPSDSSILVIPYRINYPIFILEVIFPGVAIWTNFIRTEVARGDISVLVKLCGISNSRRGYSVGVKCET